MFNINVPKNFSPLSKLQHIIFHTRKNVLEKRNKNEKKSEYNFKLHVISSVCVCLEHTNRPLLSPFRFIYFFRHRRHRFGTDLQPKKNKIPLICDS